MRIPTVIPGLKALTILVAVYGVVWIGLEGSVPGVVLLALGITLVAAGHLLQRTLGDRAISLRRWLALLALGGLLVGLSSGVLTLLLMTVKTGLHGHGPEFTPAEIDGILRQIPVWMVAGAVAGLGVGLITSILRAGE